MSEPALPELHQSVLDERTLMALFTDLANCTEILGVIPKASPGNVSPASVSLEEGLALFLSGRLRGLQIRYRYQGDEWWDTLIATSDWIRITRILQQYQ